jgi:hypothetical protein
MTMREIKIIRRLLDELHDTDGGVLSETQIHAAVGGTEFCSVAELAASVAICDTRKWITGVNNETRNIRMWGISPRGEKARTEL